MGDLPDPSTYTVKHTEAGTILYHNDCGMALRESNVLPGWAMFYCICNWNPLEGTDGRL